MEIRNKGEEVTVTKKPKTKAFSVRIPADLADYLDTLAERDHRSRGQQIAAMVSWWREMDKSVQKVKRLPPVRRDVLDKMPPRLNCRIPQNLIDEVDREARKTGLSRRVQLERMIRDFAEPSVTKKKPLRKKRKLDA